MRNWLGDKRRGLAGLAVVALLLAGGLGWATRAALRLEGEQMEAQARGDHADKLRRALWRLDSRMTAFIAREEARPFSHYSAVFAPTLAVDRRGQAVAPGTVLVPSPLLGAELPEWVLLHFQGDASTLESPQVLAGPLASYLRELAHRLPTRNVTPERACLLRQLRGAALAGPLLEQARRHAKEATTRDRVLVAGGPAPLAPWAAPQMSPEDYKEYISRKGEASKLVTGLRANGGVLIDRDVAVQNTTRNGEEWFRAPPRGAAEPKKTEKDAPVSEEVVARLSPMFGLWLGAAGKQRLVLLRLVRIGEREAAQGILLDGERLAELLADEVHDLFPEARLVPERGGPSDDVSMTMTALPFRLEPGPVPEAPSPGWTALRLGLALAWAALAVALGAVALGGWSLLDLSERRFRFVSAVTHELRTPLTTLRLYLDLMLGGAAKEGPTRAEYLGTMSAETDRLTQLIGNVLAYSRLEGQRGVAARQEVPAARLLEAARAAWQLRCETAGKELVVETALPDGEVLHTDPALVAQVLGNLLENAIKYSRGAADVRLWLRLRREGQAVVFEVEDRGPGVPAGEREAIFRPFQRGQAVAATTGGVGLGLALAREWAGLLGGRLALGAPGEGGACFRLEVPGT